VYRHSQFATPMAVGTALGLGVALAGLATLSAATLASAPWLVAALFAVLLGAFALFWRLVVEVDGRAVRATFGVGLIRRSVPLADVRRAEVIRTRVWWGYGVHWTPSGWLYNVAGRDAVRLELHGGRAVMIGTDEPDALKSAIDAALRALPAPQPTGPS
jgi:hypothetical protein